MAAPRADAYTVGSGAAVYAGRLSNTRAAPDATGGTVTQLLPSWSGTGFQLLTTAPAMYVSSGHASAVMDDAAGIAWIFGAETHNSASGMDNSVFRFDLSDGLFKRQYTKDTWPGEYRVGSDGILYANAAKTRPWAMHTFRRMRFIPAQEEIEVVYNPHEHAYWNTTIQEGATTQANNISAFWFYNVRTGTWRTDAAGSRSQFTKATYADGVCYAPGWGWYTIGDTWMYRLSEAGVYSATNLFGKINTAIETGIFLVGSDLVKAGGGADGTGWLYSKTPLSNPTASVRYSQSSYPALSGHSLARGPSVQMPDGRILLFPVRTADLQCRPMILDAATDTLTVTGHSLTLADGSGIDMRIVWSATHNCAIWITNRVGGGAKAYAYRPI